MSETANAKSEGSGASPQLVDAWFNLLIKATLTALLVIALLRPDLVPVIGRFTANLVDVEFYGAKFHFDQDVTKELAKRGIEIKDGAILVGGRDVLQVVADKAKLEAQIKTLADQNAQLQASVANQSALLQKAGEQLAGGGAVGSSGAASATPSSLGLGREIASATAAVGFAVSQSKAALTAAAKTVEEVTKPSVGAELPAVGYALVFSSDTSLEDAMNEAKKAQAVTGNPIIIYHRRNFFASVAYFGTKDAALAALPDFVKQWPKNGPFVVALGAWCPQPTLVQSATNTAPEQKNCGF
jgi:hypothetical protein